jgi:hypothetical protein
LLFPAAIVVVVILAAITVDSAVMFLGQREVTNAVAGAANDAATIGVGNTSFYRAGTIELDRGTVERLATERVRAALDDERFQDLSVDVTVVPGVAGCAPTVQVHASATVAYVFARALPGAPARATVESTSTAATAESDLVGC